MVALAIRRGGDRLVVGQEFNTADRVELVRRLVGRHERYIRRLIARRSGPKVLRRATREDIFQETLTRAIGSAAGFQYHDERRFLRWITTITRRVIVRSLGDPASTSDTLRIKGPLSTGVGVTESELKNMARTPSSLVSGREQAHELRKAIEDLPYDYRRVVTLYRLEERPLTEVAELMSRTKGATCRLLTRALQQLRMLLGDDEQDEQV